MGASTGSEVSDAPWLQKVVDKKTVPAVFKKGVTARTVWSSVVAYRHSLDHDGLVAAFQTHNDRVKTTVSPDRLLVYRVQEGWGPLCEALGVPVPDVDFPRHNPGNVPLIQRMLARLFGGRWKSLTED